MEKGQEHELEALVEQQAQADEQEGIATEDSALTENELDTRVTKGVVWGNRASSIASDGIIWGD